MKTAKEVLHYLIPDAENLMSGRQYQNALGAITGYTKQSIKADREHLLNNIYYTLENGEKVINKHLLINAPQIKLL